MTADCEIPITVVGDQSGIDLLYLLSNEAKLRDAIWIKLVLIAEGDRLECEDRFARLAMGLIAAVKRPTK